MKAIVKWLLTLVAASIAIAISYTWLDRPIALLAHDEIGHRALFEKLTHFADPFVAVAAVVFVGLGLASLSGRALSRHQTAALLCSISLFTADTTKNQLKFVFGRYWPETWFRNNPSFIRDGAYGFNPFHGGAGYASFPSGHMATICAIISVLWICYPRLRPVYSVFVLGAAIGLIGADYHFLSDIIAGAFVGVSVGWMTTALWQRASGADKASTD